MYAACSCCTGSTNTLHLANTIIPSQSLQPPFKAFAFVQAQRSFCNTPYRAFQLLFSRIQAQVGPTQDDHPDTLSAAVLPAKHIPATR